MKSEPKKTCIGSVCMYNFALCSRKVFHLFCIFLSIRLQIMIVYFYSQKTRDMFFLVGLHLRAGLLCWFNLLTFNDETVQELRGKILAPVGPWLHPKSTVPAKYRLKTRFCGNIYPSASLENKFLLSVSLSRVYFTKFWTHSHLRSWYGVGFCLKTRSFMRRGWFSAFNLKLL